MAHDPSGAPAARRRLRLRDLAGPDRARLLRWRRAHAPGPQATEKWLAGRFGPVLERCVRQILGAHTRVAVRGRGAAHTTNPHPGASGPTANRPSSTPATASSSSSSARATAWPTPPRWPSPSSPARPTTRCSSMPRPASARPTSSMPSATTSWTTAVAPPSATPPPRRSPTTSSAALSTQVDRRLQARLPRRRRPPDRRRPVPRQQGPHRGGVLPHLQRLTRPAGSSCSPATGCRERSSRSSSGSASASRPASSPTSSPPTTPRAWRSCASAQRSTTSRSPTPACST